MMAPLKTALLALCLAALPAAPSLAQGDAVTSAPERLFILPQGFAAPALSGSGPSSAFGVSVADVGSVNPAALGTFDHAAVGLAYQFETSVADGWLGGTGYDALNDARPQSVAAVVPVGAWTFGVSYQQRYAAEMDFGPIPYQALSDLDPDAALVYEMQWTSRLETVAPQVAYRAPLGTGELMLGLRVGFGYGQFESLVRTEGDLDLAFVGDYEDFSDWGTHVAAGASYRTDAYGVAAYCESALRIEGTRGVRFAFGPPEASEIRNADLPVADALPARVAVSGEFAVRPSLWVGGDVARVFWEDAWPEDADQMRDQTDASAWAQLLVAEGTEASLGLVYQGRGRWGNGIEEAFGYSGRAVYFTLGGALMLGRVRLEAVVADSRLLSADNHKQTVVKVGASVRL